MKLNWPQLENLHKDTSEHCLNVMRKKNHDYTDGSVDVFANFRMAETFGIPAEKGILLRVGDKMQRINTFIGKGNLKVEDEGVMDACDDIINYMILIKGLLLERMFPETELAATPNNVQRYDE